MFPAINFGALERYRVPADWKGRLTEIDPRDREAIPFPRPETEAATAADVAEIDRMQEILYAQGRHALLVVLQGPDTSGKDGTVRHVFGPVNPAGAVATSFKKPTQHELAHDFLWRIHKGRAVGRNDRHLQPIALRGCARPPRSRAGPGRADRGTLWSNQCL
jgi:hypothetical protein